MRFLRFTTLALITSLVPLFGQLALEQKEQDFRNLTALYAKRYAPALWKKQLLGVDILNAAPWMERVRASKSDLEFIEICYRYVASFQDVHSQFVMSSNFVADSGMITDLFEGKVLVQATTLSIFLQTPIRLGDELLAIDGRPVGEIMDELVRLRGYGNDLSARRLAADRLTFRPQTSVPRAPELGDTSVFQVRHQDGTFGSYTLNWNKSGIPITKLGPVPTPSFARTSSVMARATQSEDVPDYMKPMLDAQNWRAPEVDHAARAQRFAAMLPADAAWSDNAEGYLGTVGSRLPVFAIPPNFVVRRGAVSTDFHFSATYGAGGKRIGYLRVPSFSPPATATAELAAEIAFFEQNTDGLIVDVMENPGGGCYMLTLASYLIPKPFFFFGEAVRVTNDRIIAYSNALNSAKAAGADQWIINYYTLYLDMLQKAYAEERGMTGSIPACGLTFFENQPATAVNGTVLAYTKPVIFLTDEFSISAADIFAAMMQDNKRGPLVGSRTSGAGGNSATWPTGFYSEGTATNTATLVIRRDNVSAPGYPSAPYVENIGAHPDVYLNFMTKENLLQRGRPFLLDFTGVMVSEILKAEGK